MSELKEKEPAFVPEKVSVSLGIKANIGGPGSYNMANINYTLTGSVGSNASVEAAKAAAEEIVDAWVSEKLSQVKAKNGQ